jgi:hypothetical protein
MNLGLGISVVQHDQGSTNKGNTARLFFKKGPAKTASILKVTLKIATLFAELLDMFNNPNQKPCSILFEDKSKVLFDMLTTLPLTVYKIIKGVHRFLCHGAAFIDHFDLPIGALSESGLEARNKSYRGAGEHHARKTSMPGNVKDVFHYLFCTSDAHMFMARQ